MANAGLIFFDGFDDVVTADLPAKWTSNASGTISSGNGRNSTSSLRFTNAATTILISKTVTTSDRWVVGFAFQMNGLPNADMPIMALRDAGSAQVDLRVVSDGTLRVTRAGTTLATSTSALSISTYYYIEVLFVIATSGTYEVRVNESTTGWIPSASGNTKATANATANELRFGEMYSGTARNLDFDDVYVCTGASAAYLGDVKVVTVRPDGAGNHTDYTPSTGANYTCVDETTPNGDTDYVETTTLNAIDSYTFGALGVTGTVYGVQENMRVRNTDATATSFVGMTRIGGTDYLGGVTQSPNTTYASYLQLWENDPSTSATWSVSAVDGAEFGLKKTV